MRCSQGVEDLHSTGSRNNSKRRMRVIRHRAQKRYRKKQIPAEAVEEIKEAVKETVVEFPALPSTKTISSDEIEIPTAADYKRALVTPYISPAVMMPYVPVSITEKNKQMKGSVRYTNLLPTFTIRTSPKTKRNIALQITKPKPVVQVQVTPTVRLARPMVDLCRDRRRRITSIKRNTVKTGNVPVTRKDIARDLSALNVKNTSTAKQRMNKMVLEPIWKRFELSWDCHQQVVCVAA